MAEDEELVNAGECKSAGLLVVTRLLIIGFGIISEFIDFVWWLFVAGTTGGGTGSANWTVTGAICGGGLATNWIVCCGKYKIQCQEYYR